MLMTGTEAWRASSSASPCGPVRIPIACTIRDSTSATSRGDSPRAICSSPCRSTTAWPPSSCTPTSNDTRVRVDGLSNTSATERPSSARDERRSAFSSSARSRRRACSSAVSSAPVRKCLGMRVLSWNLYHGRDRPPDEALFTWRSRLLRATERNETHAQVNRPLRDEFAGWIADHDWDVALLQEAPPLWFSEFGRRARANGVRVLTSRNVIPPLQRAAANLNPDLVASWEGGSNQVFVRSPGQILEHRKFTLTFRPEQRRMIWTRVRLAGGTTVCVANLHASAGLPEKAGPELLAAAERAVEWSRGDPLVFGGDTNLRPGRTPAPFAELRERFGLGDPSGPNAIDHVLARGLPVTEPPHRLPPEERELPAGHGLR